jgi:hypothetical protein
MSWGVLQGTAVMTLQIKSSKSGEKIRGHFTTWIVVREAEESSPRKINHPEDAARLALEFVRASDDDKEHFWVVMLNQKHRYLMHTEASVGI